MPLPNGKVSLGTGPNLRSLDRTDAVPVIVELWGKLPGSAGDVLDMIVPARLDPDTHEGWGVVISQSLDGRLRGQQRRHQNQ